jgi:hypothetical protein
MSKKTAKASTKKPAKKRQSKPRPQQAKAPAKAKKKPAKSKAQPKRVAKKAAKRQTRKSQPQPRKPQSLPEGFLLKVEWDPESSEDKQVANRIYQRQCRARHRLYTIAKDGKIGERLTTFNEKAGAFMVLRGFTVWDQIQENTNEA